MVARCFTRTDCDGKEFARAAFRAVELAGLARVKMQTASLGWVAKHAAPEFRFVGRLLRSGRLAMKSAVDIARQAARLAKSGGVPVLRSKSAICRYPLLWPIFQHQK